MTTQSQICCLPTQAVASKGFLSHLSMAYAAWRQRRALERLDDAALNDIGLTRSEALTEARRRAWDVPAHWRH